LLTNLSHIRVRYFPESNTDDITSQLNQLDFTDEAIFVAGFNSLIGQLSSSSNYTCTNQCSSCFTALDGTTSQLCGLFSVEESSLVQNKMANFTLENILTLSDNDLLGLVDEARFYSENCIQYTGDAFDDSKVCFIVDFIGIPIDSEPVYCNITYNDALCQSCIIPGVNSTTSNDQECIVADCTNVDATYGTMINVCQNIGLGGPFQYFALKDNVNVTTFSPGVCDGVTTPTGPSPMAPTSSAPITSPSNPSTTTTTETPTSTPVFVSEPSLDDNTTSTKAPIRAPIPTPVLPAPISGTTCTISTLSMRFLFVILASVAVSIL
jgi:hypothetical protein